MHTTLAPPIYKVQESHEHTYTHRHREVCPSKKQKTLTNVSLAAQDRKSTISNYQFTMFPLAHFALFELTLRG